ncbi:MAG: hypothetical protein AAGI34_19005 [Pseudomonadota bacterium]
MKPFDLELRAEALDESTGLSWLWAFLFGPFYYAVHSFWPRALIILLLDFLVIGFLISPFMAYPAWKERARQRAEREFMLMAAARD